VPPLVVIVPLSFSSVSDGTGIVTAFLVGIQYFDRKRLLLQRYLRYSCQYIANLMCPAVSLFFLRYKYCVFCGSTALYSFLLILRYMQSFLYYKPPWYLWYQLLWCCQCISNRHTNAL